jgi:hypothetical protein
MLPAIAVLHPRHAAVRPSGAVLATIGGTSAVVLGLAGSVNVDLRPAALLVLGMWWWTLGKMWDETGVVSGDAGRATALLGVLAIAGSLLAAFGVAIPIVRPDVPYVDVWPVSELLIAGWLIGLAVHLRAAAGHTMGR